MSTRVETSHKYNSIAFIRCLDKLDITKVLVLLFIRAKSDTHKLNFTGFDVINRTYDIYLVILIHFTQYRITFP